MKETKYNDGTIIMEMGKGETMTIKELYEWAVKHGAEEAEVLGPIPVDINGWGIYRYKEGDIIYPQTDDYITVE